MTKRKALLCLCIVGCIGSCFLPNTMYACTSRGYGLPWGIFEQLCGCYGPTIEGRSGINYANLILHNTLWVIVFFSLNATLTVYENSFND